MAETLHHHYVANGYKPRCCVPWAQLRQEREEREREKKEREARAVPWRLIALTCQCHQCRAAREPAVSAEPVRTPIPWARIRETCPCKKCRLFRGEDDAEAPAETVRRPPPLSPRSRRREMIRQQFIIPGYPVPSWLKPLLED